MVSRIEKARPERRATYQNTHLPPVDGVTESRSTIAAAVAACGWANTKGYKVHLSWVPSCPSCILFAFRYPQAVNLARARERGAA